MIETVIIMGAAGRDFHNFNVNEPERIAGRRVLVVEDGPRPRTETEA